MKLRTKSKDKMVESSLGGAIIRAPHHGDESHLRSGECEGSVCLLLLEMRNKSLGKVYGGCIVGE